MTNQLTPDQQLDAAIQALLLDPAQLDEDVVARSRAASAARLDALIAPPRSASRRTRRRIIVAVATALAIVAGIALAPDLRSGGEQGAAIPELPARASAAEALEWAGDVLVTSGAGAQGSGDVWHSVSRTWRDGELRGISERWLEQDGVTRAYVHVGFRGTKRARVHLDVSRFDGDVERRRSYERRVDAAEWSVAAGEMSQLDIPGGIRIGASPIGGPPGEVWDRDGNVMNADDQDPNDHPVRRVGATVTKDVARQRWLSAAADASDADDMVQATYLYLRTTRGYYLDDIGDRNEDAQRATTIRQLVDLLTIANVSPHAIRSIYKEFAGVGRLRRLEDVRIGDRAAIRIQYETGNIEGSIFEIAAPDEGARRLADEEVVLVIDQITGAVLRTESLDRTRWTEYDQSHRVREILGEPQSCQQEPFGVPCALIAGDTAHARAADAAARSSLSVMFAHSMSRQPFLGRLDEDGLPLDPYDEPLASLDSIMCDGECEPLYPLAELPGRGPDRPSAGE